MNSIDKDALNEQTEGESPENGVVVWNVQEEYARERIDKYITEAWEEDISRPRCSSGSKPDM